MWLELRLYLVALKTLTRCPVPAWVGRQPDWPQLCLRHFPGVGLLVGAGAALVVWMAGHAWPALVSVLVSMAFTLWLTSARHETGWALVCERPPPPGPEPAPADAAADGGSAQGIGPGPGPRALGAAGAAALLLMLALKAAALHGLVVRDLAVMLATLALAHAWSRAGMVLLQRWRHPEPGRVDNQGLRAGRQQPDGLVLPVTLLWCALAGAAVSFFVPPLALLVAAAAALLSAMALLQPLAAHPAGRSAAGLDAVQQVCELAVYLAVLAYLAQG